MCNHLYYGTVQIGQMLIHFLYFYLLHVLPCTCILWFSWQILIKLINKNHTPFHIQKHIKIMFSTKKNEVCIEALTYLICGFMSKKHKPNEALTFLYKFITCKVEKCFKKHKVKQIKMKINEMWFWFSWRIECLQLSTEIHHTYQHIQQFDLKLHHVYSDLFLTKIIISCIHKGIL